MFRPGDSSVLLLVLAALLAAVWGTSTRAARRRLGRGVAVVLGLGLSAGLAVVVLAFVVGPDTLRAVLTSRKFAAG